MELYSESLTNYKRLPTREVKIGDLLLGNPGGGISHPIRVQTMTTTDTMDTLATVEQSIRCIEAGAELIRITAPSRREAENLLNIKNELRRRGYKTPIVADIHFTPNAAEIAARIVEKVRINPGNYIDKKKFEIIEYSDHEYQEEINRIRERFTPLIKICKEYGTAMRIGTNHGSLSDRIMSRYGDTHVGMVESAMEFLRIARDEQYHQLVLSMKSSNPQVMVHAYRLLVKTMSEEFGECYPLHLGVTEAGDGEDGRIKSALGIGTLLEDGLGDTIRVSLTEDPELEIPVCNDLLKRYTDEKHNDSKSEPIHLPYDPFSYRRRESLSHYNIGGREVPVVIADYSRQSGILPQDLVSVGYVYDGLSDKWHINDAAADYLFTGDNSVDFELPGTLRLILTAQCWENLTDQNKYDPAWTVSEFLNEARVKSKKRNFIFANVSGEEQEVKDLEKCLEIAKDDRTVVYCLSSSAKNGMQQVRSAYVKLLDKTIKNPVINVVTSNWQTPDQHLIHFAIEAGSLLLEGFGDGIFPRLSDNSYNALYSGKQQSSGRNYLANQSPEEFINNTAFSILQGTRTRISKTEYISCPSCGRTLFDLQETTAKIRAVTNHLKGVKIAIMGCIVNGPGEMADADFGYVGSGPGRITLYKGKDVVKRNVNSEVAVAELIALLKGSEVWVEPAATNIV